MSEKLAQFTVQNVGGSTLKIIIDYCYSGQINLTEDIIGAVMTVASQLQIVDLCQKCAAFSQTNLNTENCVEKMLRAVHFDSQAGLSGKLFDFMRERFEAIPVAQMVRMDVKSFQALLSDEKLAASEAYVLDVMEKWVEHNEADRAKHVPALIKCIRLQYVPSQVSDLFDYASQRNHL